MSQKLENLLNLALDADQGERGKCVGTDRKIFGNT